VKPARRRAGECAKLVEKCRHPADPMSYWKKYYLANNILEALQVLASAGGKARVIAGGTDLLLDLQQGRHNPVDVLVDINSIPEMNSIKISDGSLFIGAAVPLNQVVSSPLVKKHAQALKEAADLIGGPQVRNTATLGGNVAHALPAADGSIALLALEAKAEVASFAGRRMVLMTDLFVGPGCSILQTGEEILVGFYLSLIETGSASAFQRVMRPQGVALPIINMAIWIQREGERMTDLRIAVGPAGRIPCRAFETEKLLKGRKYDVDQLEDAFDILLNETHFRSSPRRASVEYRRRLATMLFRKVLSSAWNRACVETVIEE
jgi:xanthine dehydrogenase FAD-binding subunit